jgi:transposase
MYEIGIRKTAVCLYNYFKSLRKTSAALKISIASISRWARCIDIKTRIRSSPKTSEALKCFIQNQLLIHPCITCPFICIEVQKVFGFSVSRQLVHTIIKKLDFTYKRARTRGASLKKESLVTQFKELYKNIPFGSKIVSIDESGFDQRAHQVYGYAKKGEQLIITSPYCKDRKHYSLLLSVCSKQFQISKKTVNGRYFAHFINRLPYEKGTYLLLDNASIHRTQHFRDVVNTKGFNVLYTPPYSPEYNCIELIFGQIKSAFYKCRKDESFNIRETVKSLTHHVSGTSICKCFNHVERKYIGKDTYTLKVIYVSKENSDRQCIHCAGEQHIRTISLHSVYTVQETLKHSNNIFKKCKDSW